MINFSSLRTGFLRDSAVLISGAIAAQVIGLFAIPILTRLYGDSQLGMLGVFIGFTGILSQLASLRYEQALMLADEKELPALLRLCLVLCAGFAAVVALGLLFTADWLTTWLEQPGLLRWLWLVPLLVIMLGSFQIAQVLLSRQRSFRSQSTARVTRVGIEIGSQIGIALAAGASAVALILGSLLGTCAQASVLGRSAWPEMRRLLTEPVSLRQLGQCARQHANFPRYAMPAGLASTLGNHGFVLVLALLDGYATAGLFYLAHRLLALPISLVSQALCPAFYQKLSAQAHGSEQAQTLIASVFIGLFMLGALPMLVVALTGPWLFAWCFGPDWEAAGVMARSIWPAYLMMFAALPITQAFYVYDKQREGLQWQLASVALKTVMFSVAFHFGGLPVALIAYAGTNAVMYALVCLLALRWAGCSLSEMPRAMERALSELRSRVFRGGTVAA